MRLGIVACLALCLALPASAFGQAQAGGSPLTQQPNLHGCETKPTFTSQSFNGDYFALQSGQPDCTWWSTGVFGAPGVRTGAVPGDGRITSVAVRSGPTPSPLRFTVMRLFADSGSGSRQCCFFVSETPLVQPAPNTITRFPVNIAVERNTNTANGLVTQDFIGVSGVSGAGTLPMFTNGRNNTLRDYQAGNDTAAFLYPRFGSQSGDAGGGRREEGIPGVEVLLQWTWCPAGQACAADAVAPVLGRAVFGPDVFRVGPGATPVAAAKQGSKLRFSVSERSTARIRIERPRPGRRSKGRCVKPTRKLRRARRCKRWVKVGTLKRGNLPPGKVVVKFTGRIGRKALRRGRYRAVVSATDGAKNRSKVRRAAFRIVR